MTTVRIENSASSSRTSADYLALRSAGAVYVVAWVVGLLLAPSAPSQTAPDIKVQAFFQHHHTTTLIQAVLVHGVAGVAFAAFVVTLAGSRLVPRSGSARALLLVAGLAAAAVSLVQVGLEVAINRHVAGSGGASTMASLFHAVNTADTVKLVLLGLAIAAATRAMHEAGAVRRWLQGLGYALLPTLVIGGLAFVVHSVVLSGVLDLSLLLLLLGGSDLGAGAAAREGHRVPVGHIDSAVSAPLRFQQLLQQLSVESRPAAAMTAPRVPPTKRSPHASS